MMLKIFEKGKQRATVGYENGVYRVSVYAQGVCKGVSVHEQRDAAMGCASAWIALP